MPDLSPPRRNCLTLLLPLALSACNGGMAAYPSLAQRPAERAFAQGATVAAPAPTAPGAPDATTVQHVVALRADAMRAQTAFARQADETDRLAAAAHNSGTGSEAWAAATSALAALDSARSQTAVALADLDALQVRTSVTSAQANTPQAAATYAVVAYADQAVAAILMDEDARITALHKVLGT